MKYFIDGNSGKFVSDSPEGALCRAATMIYFSQGQIAHFRKTLESRKELTIVYGFKSVTITPTEE
jgi:hypothetical protein